MKVSNFITSTPPSLSFFSITFLLFFHSLFLSLQVSTYGMNEKVGTMAFPMPQEGEPAFDKPYSEATAKMIDEEARTMVTQVGVVHRRLSRIFFSFPPCRSFLRLPFSFPHNTRSHLHVSSITASPTLPLSHRFSPSLLTPPLPTYASL